MESGNHCEPLSAAVPLKVVAHNVNVTRVDFLAPISANVFVRFKITFLTYGFMLPHRLFIFYFQLELMFFLSFMTS